MAAKPWMTTKDIIESVKRKISMPLEQGTYTLGDIIATINEEMQISQVPSIMEYSEEYFVYKIKVPIEAGKTTYDIPDRAIGMKVRDIFIEDENGNLGETTRISPDNKAYLGTEMANFSQYYTYYIQGNQVIFTPKSTNISTGYIVFYVYLRPNQLVPNDRAAISQQFIKRLTVQNVPSPGDSFSIGDTTYVAGVNFAIGANTVETASNIAEIFSLGNNAQVVKYLYTNLKTKFVSNSPNFVFDSDYGILFDSVLTTWTNPDTLTSEPLFGIGFLVDFLQTKPGHKTYTFDVPIKNISGNEMYFESIPDGFVIGDYVCLANECIIPQIPPDLHNGLAERAGARILASIGDQAGLQVSMAKISEIDEKQSTLLNNRVTGSPLKIVGRNSILRANKRWGRRIY